MLVKKLLIMAALFVVALHCAADNTTLAGDAESLTSSTGEAVANHLSSISPADNSSAAAGAVGDSTVASAPNQSSATSANTPAYTAQNNPRAHLQPAPKIGSGAHLLNVTLGLFLIIGLIFGISWFVRRFGQGTFTANTHMKIIATMPLGTRERLVLIDAGGQQLLLGITPTQINTLHVFESPIVATPGEANNSEFARKLMAILQRPTTGDQSTQRNSGQE